MLFVLSGIICSNSDLWRHVVWQKTTEIKALSIKFNIKVLTGSC